MRRGRWLGLVIGAVLVGSLAVRLVGGGGGGDNGPGPTEGADCSTADEVTAWPLRTRLAQTLMVGVATPADLRVLVVEYQVGGVFLTGDDDALLSAAVIESFQRLSRPVPFLVAADEEGGRVQRIDGVFESIPSARQMAETMSPDEVEALAKGRAARLQEVGIDVALSPVLDLAPVEDRGIIGDRSFSVDPDEVVTYGSAFAAGLRDGGVLPVLKHFPGHGGTARDSHQGRAVTAPLAVLRQRDLLPFEALMDRKAGAVMVGHLDVPGLTGPSVPASLSPAAIDGLIRDELGFDGLVITDDLAQMKAVTDRVDLPDAVLATLAAGADMALWVVPERVNEVLDRLEAAVASGDLPEERVNEAVSRVLSAKGLDPCG